jgi:psp operon transcriptional activator
VAAAPEPEDTEDTARSLTASPAAAAAATDFRAAVAEYERQILQDALSRNRFNQRATAAALNLSYDQLRHALKRHKLQDSAA